MKNQFARVIVAWMIAGLVVYTLASLSSRASAVVYNGTVRISVFNVYTAFVGFFVCVMSFACFSIPKPNKPNIMSPQEITAHMSGIAVFLLIGALELHLIGHVQSFFMAAKYIGIYFATGFVGTVILTVVVIPIYLMFAKILVR